MGLHFTLTHKALNFMYLILAKLNKALLPSLTKKKLDLAKAKKWQLALIGWRYYVTTHALDSQYK
ncbi:MAG: hypothetical protein ACI9KR_000993 [Arcticibacterium sp.]|jgi:hypothetical protein